MPKRILFLPFLIGLTCGIWSINQLEMYAQSRSSMANLLFEKAESAFRTGDIKSLLPFLAPKVHVNLFTGENGYYSGEQAYHILNNFLSNHAPYSFSFTHTNQASDNLYGIGTLNFTRRGQQRSAQCFISLTEFDGKLRITQITIAYK